MGEPVCDLIGGRVRNEVPFSAYPFYKHKGGGGEGDDAREDEYGEALTPEALVVQVQQMVAKYGFGSIKFKGGVLEPDIEIETIKQLYRALGPNVPLRIDPNSAWTVETSVRVGCELAEELGRGGYLEDPTAGLDEMAEVRRRLLAEGVSTPLASNVAVTSFADIPRSVPTGRSTDHPVRPSLLGRHAPGAATRARGSDFRHRSFHAFEHAPRRLPDGHGSRGRHHPALNLRL